MSVSTPVPVDAVPPAEPTPPRGQRRRRWWVRLVAFLGILGLLAGVGSVVAYRQLNSNITSESVADQLDERPPYTPEVSDDQGPRRPLNVLLIGSDTRAGANSGYGDQIAGARGDVTILLHLSADRQRATAVSIPRDTLVQVPACRRPDGTSAPGGVDLFNSAYARGGSACVIRTVERLTDVRIDHHVVIDFAGFKHMVDALGTVPIYVPRDVDDPKSGLRLEAGAHEADGETALAYVRNRTLDDSGDLGRVERQQAFLASMLREATSTGVLTNPARLYRFLDAATRSVTTDPELADLNELRKLAQSLQGIDLDDVRFLTAPNRPHPADPNRVQLTPQADELWQALRTDSALPRKAKTSSTASPTAGAGATGVPGAPGAPGDIGDAGDIGATDGARCT
ncbi:MAG: LCP family protein [Actinomycetota bacterium]|nr:LCP family protein [Actinomycetota bacterium]